VGDGTRRRAQLGVAAVTVVRAFRAFVAIIVEGHERTGRGAFDWGAPAFGH
jgi:hypothetical protein